MIGLKKIVIIIIVILNTEVLRILDRGFNEEDIYNGIKENEDNITHNSNIKDIRRLFNENEDK